MFQKIINNEESAQAKPAPTPAANQPQAAPPASQPAAASAQQPQSAGGHRNRLSVDVEIKGNIRFQDELIIDGKVEGEISSTGALAVQENARIRAEIKVGSIIVQGKAHGNTTATQTIELRAGSEVVGDIKAAVLSMEGGAIFVGKSEVGAPVSQGNKNSGNTNKKQGSNKPQQQQQPRKEVVKAS